MMSSPKNQNGMKPSTAPGNIIVRITNRKIPKPNIKITHSYLAAPYLSV